MLYPFHDIEYAKLIVEVDTKNGFYYVKIKNKYDNLNQVIAFKVTFGQLLKFERKLIFLLNKKPEVRKGGVVAFSKQEKIFLKPAFVKLLSCSVTSIADCIKCNDTCSLHIKFQYITSQKFVEIDMKDKDLLYLLVQIDKALFPFPQNYLK